MAGIFRGDDHCYDEAHGHPSGNVSYHQFRYILSTLGTLKSRHPTIRLLVITGAVRGMPWIMKHLNDGSHTGAMMDRLGENAAWFEHNIYFLPSYKSHREGSIHWILERGSAGVEPQPTSNWYTMLTDPEAKSAYKQRWDRWVSWTNQHRKYLQVRRDLFLNTDSSSGLRGTAHMLGDRGYIFLHNAGKGDFGRTNSCQSLAGVGNRQKVSDQTNLPECPRLWRLSPWGGSHDFCGAKANLNTPRGTDT